mmetsp:Transcript_31721/g.77389  ORF Transcript_31721/g.77389 Transcript_31721/m.77389 type:complete len:331 (+) Transcript_31721:286-1278(+)
MLWMFSSKVIFALCLATSTRFGLSSPRALSSRRHCSRITLSPTAAHLSLVRSRRPTSSFSDAAYPPVPSLGTDVMRFNLCCFSTALAALLRSSPRMSTMKALILSRNFLSSSSGISPRCHSFSASPTHFALDSATRPTMACLTFARRARPSSNLDRRNSVGFFSVMMPSKLKLADAVLAKPGDPPPNSIDELLLRFLMRSSSEASARSSEIVGPDVSSMNFSVLWMMSSRVKAVSYTASSLSSLPAQSCLPRILSFRCSMLLLSGDLLSSSLLNRLSTRLKPRKGMQSSSMARHHMRTAPAASMPSLGLTVGSEILRANRQVGESPGTSS